MPDEIKTIQVDLAGVKKDISWMKKELGEIKNNLTNCIPHKIEELREDFIEYKSSNQKWLVGILVSVVFLLATTIIGLLK